MSKVSEMGPLTAGTYMNKKRHPHCLSLQLKHPAMAICKHRPEASPSSKSLLVSNKCPENPCTLFRIPFIAVWPNTLSHDIKSTTVVFAVHRWTFRRLPHLLSPMTEKSNKNMLLLL